MNIVRPVAALLGAVWIVWQYFVYGRLAEQRRVEAAMQRGEEILNKRRTPFSVAVGTGDLHCGSGRTLGKGVIEATEADTPSLAARQVGMYGFMAIAYFYLFRRVFGVELHADSVKF
jgi:hypothetical protein